MRFFTPSSPMAFSSRVSGLPSILSSFITSSSISGIRASCFMESRFFSNSSTVRWMPSISDALAFFCFA